MIFTPLRLLFQKHEQGRLWPVNHLWIKWGAEAPMLTPVERHSRISTLGFTTFIAWVPPKSEGLSTLRCWLWRDIGGASETPAGRQAGRKCVRNTGGPPGRRKIHPAFPLRAFLRFLSSLVCCPWGIRLKRERDEVFINSKGISPWITLSAGRERRVACRFGFTHDH